MDENTEKNESVHSRYKLTPTAMQIAIDLITEGYTQREIAGMIHCSEQALCEVLTSSEYKEKRDNARLLFAANERKASTKTRTEKPLDWLRYSPGTKKRWAPQKFVESTTTVEANITTKQESNADEIRDELVPMDSKSIEERRNKRTDIEDYLTGQYY